MHSFSYIATTAEEKRLIESYQFYLGLVRQLRRLAPRPFDHDCVWAMTHFSNAVLIRKKQNCYKTVFIGETNNHFIFSYDNQLTKLPVAKWNAPPACADCFKDFSQFDLSLIFEQSYSQWNLQQFLFCVISYDSVQLYGFSMWRSLFWILQWFL